MDITRIEGKKVFFTFLYSIGIPGLISLILLVISRNEIIFVSSAMVSIIIGYSPYYIWYYLLLRSINFNSERKVRVNIAVLLFIYLEFIIYHLIIIQSAIFPYNAIPIKPYIPIHIAVIVIRIIFLKILAEGIMKGRMPITIKNLSFCIGFLLVPIIGAHSIQSLVNMQKNQQRSKI